MARGAARQGEAREVTRGVGANNLIEPIDARPVFTAFSATLPRSFYSNPRTSVRARSLGSRLYPRARSPTRRYRFHYRSRTGTNGDRLFSFDSQSLDTAFPSGARGRVLFLTRATGLYLRFLIRRLCSASFAAFRPLSYFSAVLLLLFLWLRAREKRRDRRFGGRSAECFKAA